MLHKMPFTPWELTAIITLELINLTSGNMLPAWPHAPRLVHMLLHLRTCFPTCLDAPRHVHMLLNFYTCSYICARAPTLTIRGALYLLGTINYTEPPTPDFLQLDLLLHLRTCFPTCPHAPRLAHMFLHLCTCSYTWARAPRNVHMLLKLCTRSPTCQMLVHLCTCTCSYNSAHPPTLVKMLSDL